jgi:hypothetical protein
MNLFNADDLTSWVFVNYFHLFLLSMLYQTLSLYVLNRQMLGKLLILDQRFH